MSVYKMSSSRELLLKIAEIKDNIRRKYSALRNNDFETQRKLELQYKPLIKPLRTLTQRALKPYKVKREIKQEPKEETTMEKTMMMWRLRLTKQRVTWTIGMMYSQKMKTMIIL